ncbi:MAG: hypothetical protein L6Q98_04110 [Anaerolineae bacterium]|nr:hypothetical protein [Anaerolineae bacterium]
MNAVEVLAYLMIFLIIPFTFVLLIVRHDARERRARQRLQQPSTPPAAPTGEPGISEIERNAWAVTIAATERHSTHHAD